MCFLGYFLLGILPNMFKKLKAEQNVVIHHDQVTHQILINNEVRSLTIKFLYFFVITGLIVEIFFMLFSVYNAA